MSKSNNIEKINAVILRCVVVSGESDDALVPVMAGDPCLIDSSQRVALEGYIMRTDQTRYRDMVVELVGQTQLDELLERANRKAQQQQLAAAKRLAAEEKRRKAKAIERKRRRLAKLEQIAGQG